MYDHSLFRNESISIILSLIRNNVIINKSDYYVFTVRIYNMSLLYNPPLPSYNYKYFNTVSNFGIN